MPASPGALIWYRVRDIEAARAFYADLLGLREAYYDHEGRWARFETGSGQIGLAEGEPADGGVATIDVDDAKAEAERLRSSGIRVGTVLELHGDIRLVDVYDPDGNRLQLTQTL